MAEFLLPSNFTEISETFKEKIKNDFGVTDSQFQGSNMAILADIMAYGISMINTNMNFGINEAILSSATERKNIIKLARELGYEPAMRKSYKYEIRIRANHGGLIEIPKFQEFSGGDKKYYYLGDSLSTTFGDTASLQITNETIFNDLKVRKGNERGDYVLTDDGEILEVLGRVNNFENTKLLLNNISGKETSLYSKNKTKFYFYDEDTQSYTTASEIEIYAINEEDESNKEIIFQLKNLDSKFPTEESEVLAKGFFTDDVLKDSFDFHFEGFKPYYYNRDTQVIKFKLKDNTYTIKSKDKSIADLVTLYRLKRFCKLEDTNTTLDFIESLSFGIIKEVTSSYETTIVVTEGNLDSYKTNKELERLVDGEDQERGYLILDKQEVEESGVFLEISRVNDKSELILHQEFEQRTNYLANSDISKEDTTFLILQDFTNTQSYLKIYTQFAGTGSKLYSGNICYFTILTSSGANGTCSELMKVESDDFKVIPYFTDSEDESKNINNKLYSSGANEEDIESIKTNAPLFKNLAQRLVTKNDYKTYCSKFQFIEQTQVWGGEENNGRSKELGNVYFSFIPNSRSREFESDSNNEIYTLKNQYERDLFYLPETQILSQNDGGDKNSIFSELEKQKIITLQFHNVFPTYLDFSISVKLIKYIASKTEKEQRQMVFDAIKEYFDSIEHFDSDIFKSNIIKYIDRKFNDETGVEVEIGLETSITSADFIENGFNENAEETKKYKFQTLFEFPIGGIFDEDTYDYLGNITSYGKVIKDRIPSVYTNKDGFLEKGDVIEFDYNQISYIIIEKGKEVEKLGDISQIDSSSRLFTIPLIYKASKDSNDSKQLGALVVYPEDKYIYLEVYSTDSENEDDLKNMFSRSIFNKRRRLFVSNDNDISLRMNTFPRLIRVEIS